MDKKKEGTGGVAFTAVEILIGAAVLFYLAIAFYNRIKDLIAGTKVQTAITSTPNFIVAMFQTVVIDLPIIRLVSYTICFLLVLGIIYCLRGITRVRRAEREVLYPTKKKTTAAVVNKKWDRVQAHISSENPNDWKFAILEADIMLDELLDSLGYRGESIGEKLKLVEKSDFTTVDNAWEAHKVRNSIAHEGADFMINEREARRVIGLYQTAFEEFKYI